MPSAISQIASMGKQEHRTGCRFKDSRQETVNRKQELQKFLFPMLYSLFTIIGAYAPKARDGQVLPKSNKMITAILKTITAMNISLASLVGHRCNQSPLMAEWRQKCRKCC
ncbi:MAG: hypothetical protein N2748_05905 [candidate division WOR-3 bacterium]|nr:hypothetical protein [candidate division WOR-3 bacterium]